MKKIKTTGLILATVLFLQPVLALTPAVQPAYAAEEGAEGGDAAKQPPPEFEYLQLQPLTLPVITASGLMQQVSLLVSLEVPYGTRDKIKEQEPRLADAYISDLYGVLGAGGAMTKGGVLNVEMLKARLTKDTVRVLGPDKVNNVLLQAVQQFSRK